ncbi:DUF423 domain-containing protein [Microvirga sp. W0021]|uniref:DUF423 domain-containing protein n=1 Tax=Hohaiivirga grylli TaxID=3133970 RepID=A0ABV0BPB3_9HYPH
MNIQDRLLLIIAGLFGVIGVSLASLAAHMADIDTGRLATAANIMLFHTPAIIAVAIIAHIDMASKVISRLAGWFFVAGIMLFAGDLCMRVFVYDRLFANAAPTGGFLIIGGWLLVSIAAIFAQKRTD